MSRPSDVLGGAADGTGGPPGPRDHVGVAADGTMWSGGGLRGGLGVLRCNHGAAWSPSPHPRVCIGSGG